MAANVERRRNSVGWELWDDNSRRSSIEEERDTKRRVAGIRNDGGKTDENAGGYIGIYATFGGREDWGRASDNLRVKIDQNYRRGGDLEGRSRRVCQENKHYQRNLFHVLNSTGYASSV